MRTNSLVVRFLHSLTHSQSYPRFLLLLFALTFAACSAEAEKRLVEGLPAPQNIQSVIGENNVTLSWDLVAGARGYMFYYDMKSAARRGKGLSIGNSPADVGNVSRF
ncbi:MAG: hypothetical protein HYT87_16590 [Nitrospirae bacterium]|nr:hypothetical protein [Nitrospirota bacterium]